MVRRSTSGGDEAVSVMICGAKYDSLEVIGLGGHSIKGGDSMPT